MMRRAGYTVLLGFLLISSGWSADDPTVKCTRHNAGTFWPEAANTDATARNEAIRCGTLRYCTRKTFGWHWVRWTVDIRELMRKAQGGSKSEETAPACLAPDEPETGADRAVPVPKDASERAAIAK